MPKGNCLIVRAVGKQLDLLPGEASRIAQGANVGWFTDRAEIGTRFCFEDSKSKSRSHSPAIGSAFPAKTTSPHQVLGGHLCSGQPMALNPLVRAIRSGHLGRPWCVLQMNEGATADASQFAQGSLSVPNRSDQLLGDIPSAFMITAVG